MIAIISGGIDNSLSLLELFSFLESELDVKMDYIKIDWRESNQMVFVANNNKITTHISWIPQVISKTGIEKLIYG